MRDAPFLTAPAARRVLDAIEAGGQRARFVGGAVRDHLAGRRVDMKELDLATPEPPERVMELLAAAGIKAVPTGLSHGTVTAVADGCHVEITTLRRDVATFGRHAEVAFTDDFEEDARRRDLTINAMSADRDGRLYDSFGGLPDLRAGRVRFVGDPIARIREDYLRILRFFRFNTHYGRGAPDAEALEACRAEAAGIESLSGERLRAELLKLLAAPDPAPTIAAMAEAGVLARLLGGPAAVARLEHLVALAGGAAPDPLLRLAALLRPPPASEAQVAWAVERLRLSRREAEHVSALARLDLPDPAAHAASHRRGLHAHGALWRDLLWLSAAERGPLGLDEALAVESPPAFPLKGRDLVAAGVPRGREVGRLLAELEAWWVAADFRPDRRACLERLAALRAGRGVP